jgi:hypothetical protein
MSTVAREAGPVHDLAVSSSSPFSGSSGLLILLMLVAVGMVLFLALQAVLTAIAVLFQPILQLIGSLVRLGIFLVVVIGIVLALGAGMMRDDPAAGVTPAGTPSLSVPQEPPPPAGSFLPNRPHQ